MSSRLYQIVRDHCETFAAQALSWREGDGLPRFIDEEFRGFLRPFDFAQGGPSNVEGRCGLGRRSRIAAKAAGLQAGLRSSVRIVPD